MDDRGFRSKSFLSVFDQVGYTITFSNMLLLLFHSMVNLLFLILLLRTTLFLFFLQFLQYFLSPSSEFLQTVGFSRRLSNYSLIQLSFQDRMGWKVVVFGGW